MKRMISFFRVQVNPRPMPELTNILMSEVCSRGFRPIAVPTKKGVFTICETEKTDAQINSAIAAGGLQIEVTITDITPPNWNTEDTPQSSSNEAEMTLDQLLDLISQVGVDGLSEAQRQRLNELSSNQ